MNMEPHIVIYDIQPDHTLKPIVPLHPNTLITKDVHDFFANKGHADNMFSSVDRARFDECIDHLHAKLKTIQKETPAHADVYENLLIMLQAKTDTCFSTNHGFLAYHARTEPTTPMTVMQQLSTFQNALRETAHLIPKRGEM